MLFSCSKDDLENNAANSITNQLKNDLKLDQFSNKNISENLVVNWEAFSKIEKEDFEIYEIEVNEKKPSTIESNLFQSKLKYELIAIKNGTEVNSYLVEAYSNLNHDLFPNSIQSLKNFTGTLNVYELNGNLIGQLLIFNGTAKNTSGKSTIEPLNKIINLFNLKQNKSNKIPACYEAYIVFTVAYAYTDHYSSVTVGNYTHLTFVKTTLETSTTTSYLSSPYPCGTNGDSYHILQRTSTYRDVVDAVSDPCKTASITTALSKNSNYTSAKTSIQTAAADGFEHSITLGKDANGAINQAPMNSGNQQYMVSTNYNWPGAIAALHNHPNNTPLSSGDIYASVQLNEKRSNFTTTFVVTNGETYAIVVTNLALAQAFVKTFPADQLPNQSPEFPDTIFNQILDVRPQMGESTEGRTRGIAFVLDNNNAGITLMKQDDSGVFNPIKIEEKINADNSKTYNSIPCQ
jgi:hypothetical protein